MALFETIGLLLFLILVGLAAITIWMGFPGTLLVIGAVIIYNLFVPSSVVPWYVYIALVSFLGIGEILDVVIQHKLLRDQKLANVVKLVIAGSMVALFLLNL